jgi:hypothetical protein
MRLSRLLLIAAAAALLYSVAFSHDAFAILKTVRFSGAIGAFDENSPIVNAGDTFTGHYTFETTVTPIAHPDGTLDIQAIAIDNALPGTGWSLDVNSSIVSPFSVSGNSGVISIGNDIAVSGDRYVVTLDGATALPLGEQLNFFQIDIQDRMDQGADTLSDGLYTSIPDILLADDSNGGRFFTLDVGSGERQIHIEITSLDVVPEPSSWCLMLIAQFAYAFRPGRVRERIDREA